MAQRKEFTPKVNRSKLDNQWAAKPTPREKNSLHR